MNRAVWIALPALLLCSACDAPQEPVPTVPGTEPVATVRQVMLGLTVPASDLLFQIAGNEPRDDAGWERVVAAAAMLGESGNLLLVPPRSIAQPEWLESAARLVASSKDAMAAAGRRDVDAVLDAGNAIYETCENCHLKYLPRPPEAPVQP